jgi:hypothetical protein
MRGKVFFIKARIKREKKTVSVMIRLYCHLKHHSGNELCESCDRLHIYALKRLDHCQFGIDKPICAKCPVHCYKPEMREKIREIMRFSGPRMIVYHPLMALMHSIGKI